MRITSTLSILSVAALASASILRNTASDLCLDVDGDLRDGAPLILTFCDELENGDWSIDVLGKESAIIRNINIVDRKSQFCVGLVEGPNDSTKAGNMTRAGQSAWCRAR
ncbi:hypothetical protein BGZ75_006501 [Mortierella antarctica]|nr:hypothetical protein BGZ75_006501 [Mortierella antarctica]